MYTAIKQAAQEYYWDEEEKVTNDHSIHYADEREIMCALRSAEYMTLEIIERVLKKHPHLRKVFDEIEKDLAWKEHNK
tara:strand:+ start:217 stop:450 length:234 start_codon:yes stop_codon:yes gene_type:complete